MNTLTKVFIVLLVIFSISFTMMTIQFSANIPDWKDQAESWKVKSQQIDTFNRNLIAIKVAEAAKAADERRRWSEERAQLTDARDQALAEVKEQGNKLAKAESDITSQNATIKKLSAELGIAQTTAAKAREHLATLEQRNIELEKAHLDFTESLNERVATIIVLEQQTRQQEQAIHILREENGKLLKKLGLRASGIEDTTVSVPFDHVKAAAQAKISPIRGQVRNVSGELASISVGSNDGVEVGMTFIIYNRNGYLGDLEVTDVQPSGAAGVLKFINGPIAVGDMVADEDGYVAMN